MTSHVKKLLVRGETCSRLANGLYAKDCGPPKTQYLTGKEFRAWSKGEKSWAEFYGELTAKAEPARVKAATAWVETKARAAEAEAKAISGRRHDQVYGQGYAHGGFRPPERKWDQAKKEPL